MLDNHSGINQQHLRKGDVLDKTIGTVTACNCIRMHVLLKLCSRTHKAIEYKYTGLQP